MISDLSASCEFERQPMQSGPHNHALTQLLVELGDGNRSAMKPIYDQTAAKLFGLIIRITRDKTAAEDILQETYIKVWNNIASFNPDSAEPFAWLATIARNSAIDWRRAHYQRKFTTQPTFETIEDEAEPADARIQREQAEGKVMAMLSELPEARSAEVKDAFFGGMTYRELAEREQLPLGTIKSRIRRTLIQLRDSFGDE